MTNFEKIKAMTVEDMATLFDDKNCCAFCAKERECATESGFYIDLEKCKEYTKQWLEQEADDDT